jgi:hypothetical protein
VNCAICYWPIYGGDDWVIDEGYACHADCLDAEYDAGYDY